MVPKGTALQTITTWCVVGLNFALIGFFALWFIADSQAVDAAESGAGFNPEALLPNGNLMWFAAHASVLLLLAVDVCVIVLWRTRARNDTVVTERG